MLGQRRIDSKSNEIPAVRRLQANIDVAGAVVTVDAMHTQKATARYLRERCKADYVMTVKANLPGGHVEEGELPRHALLREMHEELGIGITAPTAPIARVQGPDFRNDIWLIDTWTGEPVNLAPRNTTS